MLCNRCITSLENELGQYELSIDTLSLGKVGISFHPDKFNDNMLSNTLTSLGFSLGNDKTGKLIESVQQLIKNYFETFDPLESKIRFSDMLRNELNNEKYWEEIVLQTLKNIGFLL